MDNQKFDILVNRKSGAVLRAGEEQVCNELQTIFGDRAGDIRLIEGQEIAPSVRDWLASHHDGSRGLIIGGGDGSLLTAVAETLGRTDVALGVLPLGTQNFLSRELGFSTDYKEAAAQYLHTTERAMDVGQVNGMYFLYGILTDPNCVHFFQGREAQRAGDYAGMLKHVFSCVSGTLAGALQKIHVNGGVPEREMEGRIFVVSANPFEPRPSDGVNPFDLFTLAGNAFAKKGESEGKLALYAFTAGLGNTLPVVFQIFDGTWNKHESVKMVEAQHMVLEPSEATGSDRTSIVLDGEIKETTYPLDVSILPQAVRLYRPV